MAIEIVKLQNELTKDELKYEEYKVQLINLNDELITNKSTITNLNSIEVFSSAILQENPVSPNKKMNLAIGLILGLMLGVFAAFSKSYWISSKTSNITQSYISNTNHYEGSDIVKKKNDIAIRSSAAEYLTYIAATGDDSKSFEMRYEEENIWLTQKMLATLYDVSVSAINQHIKKIYDDNELAPIATIKNFLIVQTEGSRQVN